MNTTEFSDAFDTLVSSYARLRDFDNKEPRDTIEFNEYEKSLFLTKAQEQLVISYYNGKNSTLDSFEKTEEVRRYLSELIETASLTQDEDSTVTTISSDSQVFTLPSNLWFITYESAILASGDDECSSEKELQVVPVTQDTFYRTTENPFKCHGLRRALRLDLPDNQVELVSKYTIETYLVRYIRKINPIILADLPNNINISGVACITECELHEALHQHILELAVTLALQSKGINIQQKTS